LNENSDFFGKRRSFRCRNPFQPQAALINAQQSQYLPGFFNDLLTSNITFQVMAIANVSAGYQYAVCPFQKSPQQESVIDSAGAHQADQAHGGRILDAGNTGQIGSGISAPVADKG
jgi:hypothetical protein